MIILTDHFGKELMNSLIQYTAGTKDPMVRDFPMDHPAAIIEIVKDSIGGIMMDCSLTC